MTDAPGTAAADEDVQAGTGPWLYFVHGTTTSLWLETSQISADRGRGDFGLGFYTFEDTNWGRQAATAWAQRKADSRGDTPILPCEDATFGLPSIGP